MNAMVLARRAVLFGIALLLTFSFPANAQEPVRIGFSIAKTGLFAQGAPSQINAYELWREQVNADGGLDVAGTRRPVEFVVYDDQSNPAQAVRIYEKLITDDKVDLLLAPWGTPHHIALAPVAERFKFPIVGNTAASVLIRDIKPGYMWFPTSAIPDRLGDELAAMMKENDVQSAAILANVLPFSKEVKSFLVPAMEKAGIRIIANEDYPPDIRDMTAVLDVVRRARPDVVISLSYPADSVLFARQAKELGVNAPFTFVLVGPSIAFYQQVLGPSAEGIVTIGHWSPNRSEWTRARPFYDAYVEKFGEAPDHLDSVLAYMSAEILEQAVAGAGLDREKLREAIATGSFETINGKVEFDGVQNTVTPTAFLQIQDGSLELVWPDSIRTAPFRPKESW